jgi:hypothetical protein
MKQAADPKPFDEMSAMRIVSLSSAMPPTEPTKLPM